MHLQKGTSVIEMTINFGTSGHPHLKLDKDGQRILDPGLLPRALDIMHRPDISSQ